MKIVIIGASSGLGAELASLFISAGHEVACAARRVDRIGPCAASAAIDVNSPDAPGELYELIDRLGGMDIYIHVAGIGYDNPALDPERDAAIALTDCVGFARMVSAAFNWFSKRRLPGQIAAVSSVAGTMGIATMEAYCASKRFDWTYLEGLRQRSHCEGLGIAITDIRPGWTRTPLLHNDVSYPLLMNPAKACRQIFRAIMRRKRIAYIDRRWRLLCAAWSIIPAPLWRRINPRRLGII